LPGREVLWRIGIARTCVNLLEKRIWKSSIRLDTKIWLYKTYIVPVLMYGCESWTTTRYLCARIDASDTWALVKILRIPYNRHITNPQVRAVSRCPPLSNMVMKRLLAFFGCTSHAVLLMKTITMQLLLRFTSLHQTGNDLQEDPTTRGSEPLSRI